MRRLLFATVLAMCPVLAMADESISGQWQADPGHGVLVVMDILVDGHWFSQTVQDEPMRDIAKSFNVSHSTISRLADITA